MFRRFRRQREKPQPAANALPMLPAPYAPPDFGTDSPTMPLPAIDAQSFPGVADTMYRRQTHAGTGPSGQRNSAPARPNPAVLNRQVDPEVVARALEAYLNAPDWASSRAVVEAHSELLSHTALMLLRTNIVRTAERGSPASSQTLSRFLQTLEVAQREGVAYAFEQTPWPYEVGFSPDLERLLEQLEANGTDPERRLAICQEALPLASRDQQDELWAALQREMGLILPRLRFGDHALQVDQAIEALDAALRVFTKFEFPTDWAMTQHYLGMAFLDRENGERAQNIEEAIDDFRAALEVRTRESLPSEWATTQEALGSAYFYRILGDRSENLDQSIGCFEAAMQVRSRDKTPFEWATDQLSLGNAYGQRLSGTRMGNIEQAITGFEAALTYFTRENAPDQWALIHHNLGVAYMDRLFGNRSDNIERAIEHYQQVALVQSRERAPLDWADTRNNLGNAYRERIVGEHAENVQLAITCYQDALRVRTRDVYLLEHRRTARNLGVLLFEVGRWAEAHDVLSGALAASETVYALNFSGPPSARLRDHVELVALDAACLVKMQRPRDAVQRLENGRARALDEMLERDRLALQAAPQTVRAAFESAQSRLAALYDRARQGVEVAVARTEAQAALEQAVTEVRKTRGDFMHPALTFKQISAAPLAAQALVYLSATPQGTLALIVPGGVQQLGNDHQLWVPALTTSRIEKLAPRVADAETFIKTELGHLPRPEHLDALLEVLGHELMAPLAERLHRLHLRRVALVPVGPLATLALHAAPIGTVVPTLNDNDESIAAHPDARFGDVVEIKYVPSAQRLLTARVGASIVLRSGVAAVGNPQPSHYALEWAEHEAEAVAQMANRAGQACTLLIRRQANAEAVMRTIKDRAYIHLATASAFYPERPLDSYLYLAGGDTLRLDNLLGASAPLRGVRLIVLSAGQSVMSSLNTVDESIGMGAAMLAGGAAGVVASLWPASDLATLLLMRRFAQSYLVDDLRPEQALRSAQLWLRQLTLEELTRDYATDIARDPDLNLSDFSLPQDRPYSHPLYWAGFVYMGA